MSIVDVMFRLQGDVIPADHGYQLCSAIARVVPGLHGDQGVGIAPVPGEPCGGRRLRLGPGSHLALRLDAGRIAEVLPLAGQTLQVGGFPILVGVPEVHSLEPAPSLYSRLVVIKGFMEPEPFLAAAQRQLEVLDTQGVAALIPQPVIASMNAASPYGSRSPFLRRTLRIRDREIVGFALRVSGLSAEESIRLQEVGIGGRRRFGCGFFIPDRRGGDGQS